MSFINVAKNGSLPKMSGNASDVQILRKLDKITLLKMCESDLYVLNLCNNDTVLLKIITAPDV